MGMLPAPAVEGGGEPGSKGTAAAGTVRVSVLMLGPPGERKGCAALRGLPHGEGLAWLGCDPAVLRGAGWPGENSWGGGREAA